MRFQVFNNGRLVDNFVLGAAYMFGADAIPLSSSDRIVFRDGIIDCTRRITESAGLALLWPVEDFGRILLPTTRLPERKQPYNLNVELARSRLMHITLKREDWSLFEETDGFADIAHQAQALFIQSLQNISDASGASVLADESLKKAMFFSEQLAARHAELFWDIRCKNRAFGRHTLGCEIEPQRLDDQKYCQRLFEIFGQVSIPVSWAKIEPQQGRYDFSLIDKCLSVFAHRRLAVFAGPVLCFSEEYLPQWLMESGWEYEKIREYAFEYVSTLVGRYASQIHTWRLISGMNAYNFFRFNFEQAIEMTRSACLAARNSDGKSGKLVEIAMPWGEYYAFDRETIPPLIYADVVIQSGIGLDGFGLLLHFGKDQSGMHIRDMMQISSRLDFFAAANKPLYITGLSIPGRCGDNAYDCGYAGLWHRPWDAQQQSQWIEQLFKIALSKPFVQSVTYSVFADGAGSKLPSPGLLDEKLEPKDAFAAVAKLQKSLLKK